MSYGPDTVDIFRRAAAYVDRILKGASRAGRATDLLDKPSDTAGSRGTARIATGHTMTTNLSL